MKVINRLAKGSSLHSCEPMRNPGLAGCRPAETQPKGTPHLSQLRNAHPPDSPSSADYSVRTHLPFDMLTGLVLLTLEIDYAGHERGTVINSGLRSEWIPCPERQLQRAAALSATEATPA